MVCGGANARVQRRRGADDAEIGGGRYSVASETRQRLDRLDRGEFSFVVVVVVVVVVVGAAAHPRGLCRRVPEPRATSRRASVAARRLLPQSFLLHWILCREHRRVSWLSRFSPPRPTLFLQHNGCGHLTDSTAGVGGSLRWELHLGHHEVFESRVHWDLARFR